MLDGVYCLDINNAQPQGMTDFDVVFVHGLGSSAEGAWQNANSDLWPLWIRQVLPLARVTFLNYPAPVFFYKDSSRVSIRERARNLADFLPINGIGNRQTVFVCHSLGGLLVKEILRSCIESGCSPKIAANTAGIIFLATPHAGADLANWGSAIGSELTKDIERDSAYLIDLRQWFAEYANSARIGITAYYETMRYKGALVVAKESADPCCSSCMPIALDADHSTICKPASPNSDIFLRIKRDIEMAIASMAATSRNISCIDDVLRLPDLTNPMYFDVLNFLHRLFAESASPVSIISNPGSGIRPCCFIVTKDPLVLRSLSPLVERWPDRFITHAGVVGALTAAPQNQTDHQLTTQLQSVQRTPISDIAKAVAKLYDLAIDINVASFLDESDEVRIATAAHILELATRNWCESVVSSLGETDNQPKAKASKPSKKSSMWLSIYSRIKNILNVEADRSMLVSECLNAIYKRNSFSVRLNNYFPGVNEKKYSNLMRCHIESADFASDVVILVFSKKRRENSKLTSWLVQHKELDLKERQSRASKLKAGETCFSPLYADKKLKVVNPDEFVFIPLSDKVIRMKSVIVISGESGELGTSGSPIYDKNHAIVAMTIGKTIMDGKSNILATPFDQESAAVNLLSKRTKLCSE